jgi:predicted DNA-binding transcriptional regulator AlpA
MTPHGVIAMTKRFLSKKEVRDKVKLSFTEIARRVQAGKFPKPLRLGPYRTSRTVWWEHDIDAWMDEQNERWHAPL